MRAGKRKGSPDSIPALPFPGDSGAVRTRDPQLRRLRYYLSYFNSYSAICNLVRNLIWATFGIYLTDFNSDARLYKVAQ